MSESFTTTPDAETDEENEDHEVEILDSIERVPIEEIEPYSNNPKEHPPSQIDRIAASIRNYGWDVPMVIDAEGTIIKGHGRFQAARKLGLDEVPVIHQSNLSGLRARGARIADNKSAESEWDTDLLQSEVDAILEESEYEDVHFDVDAETLGFEYNEFEDLTSLMDPPETVEGEESYEEQLAAGEGEGISVVLNVEDDADAEFIGTWAEEQGFEWHVVDS